MVAWLKWIIAALLLVGPVASFAAENRIEVEEVSNHLRDLSFGDQFLLKEHLDSLARFSNQVEGDLTSKEQVDAVHEAFEAEDEGTAQLTKREKVKSFLSTWAKNLNFKRIFYNIHRYYFMDTSTLSRESIRDLISIFMVSHGTEVSYGVLSVLYTVMQGYSTEVVVANGVTGLIISSPGTDPLCWVLLGSYGAGFLPRVGFIFRPYQKVVRFLRIFGGKAGSKLAQITGLKKLFNKLTVRISALDLLTGRSDRFLQGIGEALIDTFVDPSGVVNLRLVRDGADVVDLWLRDNQNQSLSVVKLEVPAPGSEAAELATKYLKAISGNLQYVVSDTLNALEQGKAAPGAVQEVKQSTESLRLNFLPGALTLGSKRVFRRFTKPRPQSQCSDSFT